METARSAIANPGLDTRQPSPELSAEGPVAKAIETTTSRLPSDWFLWAALGAVGTAAALQLAGKPHRSQFVGQWVPTLLILGLYNKLVKVAGSDRT